MNNPLTMEMFMPGAKHYQMLYIRHKEIGCGWLSVNLYFNHNFLHMAVFSVLEIRPVKVFRKENEEF